MLYAVGWIASALLCICFNRSMYLILFCGIILCMWLIDLCTGARGACPSPFSYINITASTVHFLYTFSVCIAYWDRRRFMNFSHDDEMERVKQVL